MPFDSPEETKELYHYIKTTWPYWNQSVRLAQLQQNPPDAGVASQPNESHSLVAVHLFTRSRRQVEAQQTRHFITLTCDHGPACAGPSQCLTALLNPRLISARGPVERRVAPPTNLAALSVARPSLLLPLPSDCMYVERSHIGQLPDDWDPIKPTRVVGHVLWNGIRDGYDAGNVHHADVGVCFQHGKDIQLATAENVCGPLCGYKRDELMRLSVWTNATAPQERLRGADLLKHSVRMKYLHYTGNTYDRPTVLFYGGNIHTKARGEGKTHTNTPLQSRSACWGAPAGRAAHRCEGSHTLPASARPPAAPWLPSLLSAHLVARLAPHPSPAWPPACAEGLRQLRAHRAVAVPPRAARVEAL